MKEITAEYKEDLWRIPRDTEILAIKFELSMSAAQEIVARCRELHQLIIDGHVWAGMAQDVKDYLNENLHVAVMGDIEHHSLTPAVEKEIREAYSMGNTSVEQLAKEYGLPYNTIKHIIEKR